MIKGRSCAKSWKSHVMRKRKPGLLVITDKIEEERSKGQQRIKILCHGLGMGHGTTLLKATFFLPNCIGYAYSLKIIYCYSDILKNPLGHPVKRAYLVMLCAKKNYQFVTTSSDCGRYPWRRQEGQSWNAMSESAMSESADSSRDYFVFRRCG